jgi:hypothetical protein
MPPYSPRATITKFSRSRKAEIHTEWLKIINKNAVFTDRYILSEGVIWLKAKSCAF